MQFLLAPGSCTELGRFRLIDAPDTVPDAAALIERFCPGARHDPGDTRGLARPILATGSWPRHVYGAEQLPGDALVMLIPDGNFWGFSELSRACDDPVPGQGAGLTARQAQPHLESRGKLRVVGGNVVEADPDTLRCLQHSARKHRQETQSVHGMLEDEASRATYQMLLTGTIEDVFDHYSATVGREVQYFECLHWFPGMTIVNGGVQEGFELPYFAALTGGDLRVLCADPAGFGDLAPFVAPIVDALPDSFVELPYALWSHSGRQRLPVSKNGAVLSQFKDRNMHGFEEVEFECRSIDDLVAEAGNPRVDLIKLDVEGAEPWVLDGMEHTLARGRPQFAVSIYHWPEHMWELPLRMAELLDDYAFYVRHYSYGRWETILYAVPRELL